MSRAIEARDSRGTMITPGSEVAYNRSGHVIRGTILTITSGSRYGYVSPIIRVQAHPEFQQGRDDTKPSIVRNPRSVLVL